MSNYLATTCTPGVGSMGQQRLLLDSLCGSLWADEDFIGVLALLLPGGPHRGTQSVLRTHDRTAGFMTSFDNLDRLPIGWHQARRSLIDLVVLEARDARRRAFQQCAPLALHDLAVSNGWTSDSDDWLDALMTLPEIDLSHYDV